MSGRARAGLVVALGAIVALLSGITLVSRNHRSEQPGVGSASEPVLGAIAAFQRPRTAVDEFSADLQAKVADEAIDFSTGRAVLRERTRTGDERLVFVAPAADAGDFCVITLGGASGTLDCTPAAALVAKRGFHASITSAGGQTVVSGVAAGDVAQVRVHLDGRVRRTAPTRDGGFWVEMPAGTTIRIVAEDRHGNELEALELPRPDP